MTKVTKVKLPQQVRVGWPREPLSGTAFEASERGKQPGNGRRDRGRSVLASVREVVMGVVEVDPLAVLPITAASASAAFARATDPGRDFTQRQEQLRSLRSMLASVRRQLDQSEQAVARLTTELGSICCGRACSTGWAVCRRCLVAPLSRSAGVGRGPRCQRTVQLDRDHFACGERATVVLRDATGAEQGLCMSHAVAAIRRTRNLAVVSASRPNRAVLGEVAGESCVVRRHASLLVDSKGAPRDG